MGWALFAIGLALVFMMGLAYLIQQDGPPMAAPGLGLALYLFYKAVSDGR